jgi:hypothetical protein
MLSKQVCNAILGSFFLMGNLCCHLQSKLSAHASTSVAHASIEENITVVDKVVDDGWGSPRASLQASSSGILCCYLIILLTVKLFHEFIIALNSFGSKFYYSVLKLVHMCSHQDALQFIDR